MAGPIPDTLDKIIIVGDFGQKVLAVRSAFGNNAKRMSRSHGERWRKGRPICLCIVMSKSPEDSVFMPFGGKLGQQDAERERKLDLLVWSR